MFTTVKKLIIIIT